MTLCQLCRSKGTNSPLWTRSRGAAAICPRCDRSKCACGTVLLEGDERQCPKCRRDVRLDRKVNP